MTTIGSVLSNQFLDAWPDDRIHLLWHYYTDGGGKLLFDSTAFLSAEDEAKLVALLGAKTYECSVDELHPEPSEEGEEDSEVDPRPFLYFMKYTL